MSFNGTKFLDNKHVTISMYKYKGYNSSKYRNLAV